VRASGGRACVLLVPAVEAGQEAQHLEVDPHQAGRQPERREPRRLLRGVRAHAVLEIEPKWGRWRTWTLTIRREYTVSIAPKAGAVPITACSTTPL
jgi:hypothetical protein